MEKMPRSEAQKRAENKYKKEKLDTIIFRVPAGYKEYIQKAARDNGYSVARYILRAVVAMYRLDIERARADSSNNTTIGDDVLRTMMEYAEHGAAGDSSGAEREKG